MPESGRRGFRGGPPPWWPEGADWPPSHDRRPAVRKRLFLFLIIPFGLLIFFITGAAFLASTTMHDGGNPKSGWDGPPVAGIVIALVAIFFVIRFLRRATAPIADLMEAADRVAAGDYGVRVEHRGPRDVRRMAASFNEMTARLEANEEQRRRLLADVTHELRTPLSIIRGNAEGLLDGVYPRDDSHLAPIVEETKQMARLLDDLHTLATAEAGALRLHKEFVNVADLIRDTTSAFAPRFSEKGVLIELDLEEMPESELDPIRLRQVIENLLANALRYTPPEGRVAIQANLVERELMVSITDTGPGVAPHDLPHLFNRFTKSADSGGSGLGLAIARSLVEAHDGEITARNRSEGGLVVRITIPVAE